jgi:hypothetical protein
LWLVSCHACSLLSFILIRTAFTGKLFLDRLLFLKDFTSKWLPIGFRGKITFDLCFMVPILKVLFLLEEGTVYRRLISVPVYRQMTKDIDRLLPNIAPKNLFL